VILHPSPDVTRALIQLSDALCSWERATGRRSVMIVREQGGWSYRAADGKPMVPADVPDILLLASVEP
jgi:hypothetical protein